MMDIAKSIENIEADLKTFVETNDICGIQKIVLLVEEFLKANHADVYDAIKSHPLYKLIEKSKQLLSKWRRNLKPGDVVEVFVVNYGKWYESKILELKNGQMKVHYQGWHEKFDTWHVIEEINFVPRYIFTKGKTKSAKKSVEQEQPIEELDTPVVEEPSEDMTLSKSGRKIKASTNRANESKQSKSKDKDKLVIDKNDWICGICNSLESADGTDLLLCDGLCRRSFHFGCIKVDPNTTDFWFCEECQTGRHTCFVCKVQGIDEKEVVCCSVSQCGKYYHKDCLLHTNGLFLKVPVKDTKKNIPINNKPQVSKEALLMTASGNSPTKIKSTHDNGGSNDNNDENGYHANGIAANGVNGTAANHDSNNNDNGNNDELLCQEITTNGNEKKRGRKSNDGSNNNKKQKNATNDDTSSSTLIKGEYETVSSFTFKCPHHSCDTCDEFYGSVDKFDLAKCLLCPRAFHANCMPPGTRFNSMFLLCKHHPNDTLPSNIISNHNKNNHLQNLFATFYEELTLSDLIPNEQDPFDNHFKLQLHIKEEIDNTPTNFKMIRVNDYDTLSAKTIKPSYAIDVCCECSHICDENCLNRLLNIECCDNKNKNGEPICGVGGPCSNRRLQDREYAAVEVFRENNMGWGLKAAAPVTAGSLVIEYVGEIIDYEEVRLRMNNQGLLTPNDHDFYIMELEGGLYVDGKFKGNNSRFINHSCDPNCELQRWIVKGQMRIAITAIKDIKQGEPFSYDYQFDTSEADTFKCYCGASKCRGTMAPKKKELFVAGKPLSKLERMKLILAGKNKEKKSNTIENRIEDEWSRSYTSAMIPGDKIHDIKSGPVKGAMKMGRDHHLLLARNVKLGANFWERREKWVHR